jgi:Transaldolase/Fructose-6-phosphate aldolase
MATNKKLAELSEAGVAVWLDDLSRGRIHSGDLQSLVDDYSVVGITTNPTIFAAAISASGSYDDQVHHRRRCPRRLRPAHPGSTAHRPRRPGVARGGPRASARH